MPPVHELIHETPILSIMAQFLSTPIFDLDSKILKHEVIWVLTNIAMGPEEDALNIFGAEYNIMISLNDIIQSGDLELLDLIVWFFANACGDSTTIRNIILDTSMVLQVMA